MSKKQLYADKCFGLSVDQIKDYDELTPEQMEQCYYIFGKAPENSRFVYAVKLNGDLVPKRERLRLEWENVGRV